MHLRVANLSVGKTHGAASATEYIGGAPEDLGIEAQQLGWPSTYKSGVGADTITSGIEVVWTKTPTKWSNGFLTSLYENEWTLVTGPGGAYQWTALNGTKDYPEPFSNTSFNLPRMLTSDLALREDDVFANISRGYLNNFTALTDDFSRAWYLPWPSPSYAINSDG